MAAPLGGKSPNIFFADIMDKDESDNKDALDKRWIGLVEQADTVRQEMHVKKAEFKDRKSDV